MVMRYRLWVLIILVIFAVSGHGLSQNIVDKGSFVILNKGRHIGSEEFNISLMDGAGRIVSTTNYEITHEARRLKVTLQSTLALERGLVPSAYDLVSQSGFQKQSLNVEFQLRLALCKFTLDTGEQTQAAILPPEITIVDENIFSHWTVLLSRYNMKAKGSQVFTVFVPQMGTNGVGPVNVQYLGKERIKVGYKKSKAMRFKVASSNLSLDIWQVWQDKTGRILKIISPKNDTEVVRVN